MSEQQVAKAARVVNIGNGELPEGWAVTALGECIDILDSMRVPVNSKVREHRKGPVPYYGATGQVGWIDDYLFDEELLLIGEDGAPFLDNSKPIAYMVKGKSWVNNHAHVLRALTGLTSNCFLKHQLNRIDFSEFVTGSTRLKLNQGAMRRIPIALPPIAEQQRIVTKVEARLERVNKARERLARVPGILKRFRQSVLAAACSGQLTTDWREDAPDDWQWLILSELITAGPQNGLYKPRSAYGKGTAIVRISNFYDGVIQPWDTLDRLTISEAEANTYGLHESDILVNRVNSMPFLGKSGLVRGLDMPCVFESNMMRFTTDPRRIVPEYLIRYLSNGQGLAELRKNAKHAVNQASINQKDVGAVKVPVPPLLEQHEIVRRVSALFALADRIEQRLTAATTQTERITQSVLAKAFFGELVETEADLARHEGRDYELASVLLERIAAERQSASNGKPKRTTPARAKRPAKSKKATTQ